jgi:uncharacterized protein (DUF4415 family)
VKNEDIFLTKGAEKELKALKHRKINLSDPDAPEIQEWNEVAVGKFYRPVKKQITVRVDADVLEWFRHAAKKYQTLINKACREYMEHHIYLNKIKKKKTGKTLHRD